MVAALAPVVALDALVSCGIMRYINMGKRTQTRRALKIRCVRRGVNQPVWEVMDKTVRQARKLSRIVDAVLHPGAAE